MDRKKMTLIALLALTMVYGGTLGVLGMMDSAAVGLVAMIGAMIVGIGWVLYGTVFARSENR